MSRLTIRGSKWRRLRKKLLKAVGYRCSKCGIPGRLEVDHIIPLHDGGAAYDENNLQVLCRECHFIKSGYKPFKDPEERLKWQRFVNEIR